MLKQVLPFTIILQLFACMSPAYDSIDQQMIEYSGEDTPGAAVMVIKDGKPVFTQTYGTADIENKTPIAENTNFRLASVSKQFTATAILLLIQDGKLSLKTPVKDILEELPEATNNITIHHLLNHTSGIIDYEDFVPDTAMNPQIKDAGVYEILKDKDSLYFSPGDQFRYSNSAYSLLALVVEKISGKNFAGFLKERIFLPLGMNETLAYEKGISEVKNRAYGHDRKDGKWIRRDQSSTSAVLGDGGIYSSLTDLFKWDQALYGSTLLNDSLRNQMVEYQTLNNGETIKYGLGFHLKRNENGEEIVYHTGSTTSFRNIYYRIPSKKLSIILLTNRNSPGEFGTVPLAEAILKEFDQ